MASLPLHIILADDDHDDCFLFKEAIDELSLSVELTIVHDGEELMQRLTGSAVLPDAIFLDLNMPKKNGFECLAEIQGTKNLKGLPVIICTTSYKKELIDLLHKNGAYYFIHKPSDFNMLKDIVKQALTHISSPHKSKPAYKNFVLNINHIG